MEYKRSCWYQGGDDNDVVVAAEDDTGLGFFWLMTRKNSACDTKQIHTHNSWTIAQM